MKKFSGPPRSSHDRWLVSYADLVTLLFAFFTTLYAASAVDATGAPGASGSAKPSNTPSSSESSADATATDATPTDIPTDAEATQRTLPPTDAKTDEIVDEADALRARLSARLEDDVRLQRADIVRDGRGVVVSLPERATFAVGSAVVTPDARPLIAKVVAELNEGRYALRIEGHTDDVPIRTVKFPSNWELSTARAGAVVAYLIGELRFPADRLSAAGYGEFHPRVANDSPANRARNRRIDIVVMNLAEDPAKETGAR